MRHPLWIVNSSLLLLFFLGLVFIYFTQQELPRKKPVTKKSQVTMPTKKIESIALSKIYENDLFDTVKQPLPELHNSEKIQEIPTPPGTSAPLIPREAEIIPLPALNVTLKGIMIVSDNSNNIAMICDNATSKEKNYKVGDVVQDSQIVKIFNNRIVFVRSNGQQETLYLNEKDLLSDPVVMQNNKDWTSVVTTIKENEFELYPQTFLQVVPNLAALLDMFEITTVYKEGKSIGCRIGDITSENFAATLGLQSYDIITKVLDKPVATFDERLAAYEAIENLTIGDTCIIELIRNKQPLSLKYTLDNQETSVAKYKTLDNKNNALNDDKKGILTHQSPEELEYERIAMLKEKYQFAPTMQEILLEQKRAMLHEGQEKRLEDFSFVNEA